MKCQLQSLENILKQILILDFIKISSSLF